ncbi:hypothetical protein GKR48_14420 [Providencia sp. wls1943]|uniref:hypothetical protein n=1 Tax=Providencia sp. wls1943 TaxID=2675150 RepID=UPI0012B606AA|nr:hypothetical protein [Providencia sp. wls1943]MTB68000.1 hypothetical protein [Providencia sp. wls1943]
MIKNYDPCDPKFNQHKYVCNIEGAIENIMSDIGAAYYVASSDNHLITDFYGEHIFEFDHDFCRWRLVYPDINNTMQPNPPIEINYQFNGNSVKGFIIDDVIIFQIITLGYDILL